MATPAERDLGPLLRIETEAIGEPGQRRFRLRLGNAELNVSLWLEKEQVRALATAIQQILAQNRSQDDDGGRVEAPPLQDFPLNPDLDFQVGRLAFAYDDSIGALALFVTDIEHAQAPQATLRASFTRDQARFFSAQAETAIAAGRALCPLCQIPLEGYDHLCPPTNGHSDDVFAWLPPPEIS